MTMKYSPTVAINEMHRNNLRPASTYEPGWYWRGLDGYMYWVTSK